YVIQLSLRGESELYIIKDILSGGLQGSIESNLSDNLTSLIVKQWVESGDSQIPPVASPATSREEELHSAAPGYALYVSAEAACNSCPLNLGRASTLYSDGWGTITRPRNLTGGVYRGGDRPLDLFRRVYAGIVPKMPAYADWAKLPEAERKTKEVEV